MAAEWSFLYLTMQNKLKNIHIFFKNVSIFSESGLSKLQVFRFLFFLQEHDPGAKEKTEHFYHLTPEKFY